MTSVRTDPDAAAADRAQTFLDWTRINAKALTAGAIVVIVAAAGYWFYMRSRQIQSANAEKALMQAKQSLGAGNLALAQSDLQSVQDRIANNISVLTNAKDIQNQFLAFLEGRQNDLSKADTTEAAVRLQTDSQTLQVSFASIAKISQLSLLNYL